MPQIVLWNKFTQHSLLRIVLEIAQEKEQWFLPNDYIDVRSGNKERSGQKYDVTPVYPRRNRFEYTFFYKNNFTGSRGSNLMWNVSKKLPRTQSLRIESLDEVKHF